MAQNTASKQLFDLLVSRDFDPELLDSTGRPAPDPQEAEIFSFDFRAQSGKDYGTVVLMIGDDNNLEVFCADNVGKTMEGADKNEWFAFLQQLKHFAVKNFMEFNIKNLNRLRYSMQGQAAIKEGLFESWSGNRTTSWTGVATEARLMIKHKKALDENDARFRYVESLFIETTDGERFKLPFTKLSGGRAMLEHVRQGGKPYDLRGQHIVNIVEELNILNRFRRANHGQIFEGDTAQLVTETDTYYKNLQHNLKTLEKQSGYKTYFENWNPTDISEQDVVIESLKNLFVKQTIDTRIEQALPLLARIQQQGQQMKEANIFESWINNLAEGTWQTPDTPEKQEKLLALLSADLPVGPDATNATEQLYDLLGDDVLFDQLENLAQKDANADARQVVIDRMQELSGDPNVLDVINALNVDSTAEMNPPDATNPVDLEPADGVAEAIDDAQSYPEYADDLSSILKNAGVEPQDNPAPDYEEEVVEGQMNQISMFYDDWMNSEYAPMDDEAGDDNAVMAKAKAFLSGEVVPEKIDAIAQVMAQNYHGGGVDEGVLGAVGGAMGGGMLGTMLGGAIGGPIGAAAGHTLGAVAGGIGGQELTKGGSGIIEDDKEEDDSSVVPALAGAALGAGLGYAAGSYVPSGSVDVDMVSPNIGSGSSPLKGADSILEKDEEETNEGSLKDIDWKEVAGSTAGGTAGYMAGNAVGGPIAGLAAAGLGSAVGGALAKDDAPTEGKLGALGGGVLGMAATKSAKGTVAGAKLGSAIQDRFAKKNDSSALAGQYGHSGKMKEVSKDTSFLDRLKELSGLKR